MIILVLIETLINMEEYLKVLCDLNFIHIHFIDYLIIQKNLLNNAFIIFLMLIKKRLLSIFWEILKKKKRKSCFIF